MRRMRYLALALLLCALTLVSACARKPAALLADEASRREIIDALVGDPAMRGEVLDRMVPSPDGRAAVVERLMKEQEAAELVVQRLLADDRGKALVVSRVAADETGAKTFIRMLMLTGAMGTAMSQAQAEVLGLGDAFALGNQRKTMADLKRLGALIDRWPRKGEGQYPICPDFGDVASCLARRLTADELRGLRLADAWGTPMQYHTDREGRTYALLSFATDRRYDGLGKVGPTQSFDCDIVFSGGEFIQWPGRIRKGDVR